MDKASTRRLLSKVGFAEDAREKIQNHFTPKAFAIQYWDREVSNKLPKPSFLLSKVSPLSATDAAIFAKLAATNSLSARLPEFCSAAHLLCFPDERASTDYHPDAKIQYTVTGDKINYGGSDHKNGSLAGMFFRKSMLKQGTVMPIHDHEFDKFPERSFLPRSILSKLPFSSSELKRLFRVSDNSPMDKILQVSLGECERAPNQGEIKRCVGSIEDMIDFATSVLGRHITVRTTDHLDGFNKNVLVGRVNEINGGKVIQSVTCHQMLFPYLLYYCHSVPKVRVYEVDLFYPNSNAKTRGVATCHMDTTSWSPTHSAFVTLGSGPGRIEVCHWISPNGLIWTTAD